MVLTSCLEEGGDTNDDGHEVEAAQPQETDRLQQVLDAGELAVCTTGDYPPFTELDEDTDELTGIDVDMAQHLADTMGVDIEWVNTSWDSLMEDFLASCDVAVGGISMNPDRAEQVFFTEPILEDGKTPIARCENAANYQSINDINQPDVTSIFPEGGTNQEFAEANYPDGELVTHANLAIFDELAAGNADVMTTDRAEVLYIANEYDALCATLPDETFDYSLMGYMLPQDDATFKHYVDQWLTIALNDGTYEDIAEPWVGNVELSMDN
nr:transporter substrate-binding domain-containing protein [Garicola koreensis]